MCGCKKWTIIDFQGWTIDYQCWRSLNPRDRAFINDKQLEGGMCPVGMVRLKYAWIQIFFTGHEQETVRANGEEQGCLW